MSDPLIIIGASARAAAQSAIHAGYSPWCIDLFADIDLQAIAPVKRCPRGNWPAGILDLLNDAPMAPVLLTGAMENHIEIVRRIEAVRPLFTGIADAIARLRSPRAMREALVDSLANWSATLRWRDGIVNAPAVNWDDDLAGSSPLKWRKLLATEEPDVHFIIKPRSGAGGKGIRFWQTGDDVAEDEYAQRVLPGRHLSAAYRVGEHRGILKGITEQLIGDPNFGAASSFTYVGNILPAPVTEEVRLQFLCAGRSLIEWSGLTGVFGIDAVLPDRPDASYPLNHGRLHVIDINPRYTASMELLDRPGGTSILGASVPESADPPDRSAPFSGKAIVYARAACEVSQALFESDAAQLADIPSPGERMEAGDPVCTVFARGATRDACYAGLREMAAKAYTRLQPL